MTRTALSSAYDRLVLGHPVVVLLLLLATLGFFASHAKDFTLDASTDALLLENDEDLRRFREVYARYGEKEYLFVAFTPKEDLLSNSSLATLRKLTTEIAAVDRVDSILSLLEAPLVKQVEGSLVEITKNYRILGADDIDLEKAREELRSSPIFKNLIISPDAQTTAFLVYLKENPRYRELQTQRNALLIQRSNGQLSGADAALLEQTVSEYGQLKRQLDAEDHQTIAAIREILNSYSDSGTLYLGGVPLVVDDMITFISNDLMVFGIGVFTFLIVMLSLIFRRIRWVLLPLASCAFAGLLMVGFLGLVGWQVTVISSNFISLMLIITMSMNIHLVVRYRKLCKDHPDLSQHELVFLTTRRMVWPCFYTALTTIMAFTSLVVSDIKPVIDFGWMMTIGLSVTFLTTFLLFPALLVMLKSLEVPASERDEIPFTSSLANITEHHGGKVLVLALIFAVVSGLGIARLEVENSFISYFSKDTEIYQGLKLIDQKMGGTTPLDIILRFPPEEQPDEDAGFDDLGEDFDDIFGEVSSGDKSDFWFTPDKIDRIKAVHDYLEGLPAVGKVLSLASVIRVAEDLNQGEELDTLKMGILYKKMPTLVKEGMIDPFVSIENDEARVNLRILDSLEDLRRKELLEQIRADLVGKLGIPEQEVEVTGLLVLYNNMLQSLFHSQIMTLGAVMLGIALMLLILFRSVLLAVIGIAPNILAAAMILGLMGWLRIPLDMMTITIAAITVGIAVDNSIHYIYRFREEFSQSHDYLETLHYCHANIGKAVFYTAITIIVGFSILVMSNFIPTIYFGLLTALAMFIALLAALTLLPKLILVLKPF